MRSVWVLRLGAAVLLCGLTANRAFAQQFVHFRASDPYTARTVQLTGSLEKPLGTGPFPAVILMHGCGGWQPAVRYSLELHAERLLEHGYVVLDVDSFGPRHLSGEAICSSYARLRAARDYRTYDAFDAMRYLRTLPFVEPRDIFLMGQSNGGSVALEAAQANAAESHDGPAPFRGVVAYYPWCGVYSRSATDLASPLLIFGGGDDDWVSARSCEALKASGASLAVVTYPGADHSFDVDIPRQRYLGHLVGYDPQAAEDSDARMLAFFNRHLTSDLKRR